MNRYRSSLLPLLLATLCSLSLSACSSIPVEHLPNADALPLIDESLSGPDAVYRIHAGDDVEVKFFYTPELNEAQKVRPDGYISLQLVNDVKAAGLTTKELDEELARQYAAHLKNPVLTVMVRSFSGFRAYVGGEVSVPQIVSLDGGVTPLQAIFRAGGVKPTAKLDSVILIRKGPDGKPLTYRLALDDDAISLGVRDSRIALQSSDIVYVPRSTIANANKFVQQYIVDLLLFRGIQLGFSHDYVHDRGGDN